VELKNNNTNKKDKVQVLRSSAGRKERNQVTKTREKETQLLACSTSIGAILSFINYPLERCHLSRSV